MYTYKYEEIKEYDDPTDIAFHNMGIADKNHNLTFFISGAYGWINANKDKSFYDLEKELRKRSFNTHLFAKLPKKIKNSKIYLPNKKNDPTSYKYECIFSCRPKKDALEEVLQHWPTYEQNLEALKLAGCVGVENTDSIKNGKDTKIFNGDEANNLNLVCENKRKIIEKYQSAEDVILDITENIKKIKGVVPKFCAVSTSTKGLIYGATIGKEIVADVGYIEVFDKTGNKYLQLVEIGHLYSNT